MMQQCGSCGRLGVVENDGHSCEVRDRPAAGHGGAPTGWRVSIWAALVLTGAYLIVCLARLVAVILDRQLMGRIADDPHSVSVRDVLDLANAESTINGLYTLTVFAYIVGFLVFFAMSRQLLRRLGYDARAAMRHWSVAAWRIGILVSVVLTFAGRTPSMKVTDPGWAAAWQSADSERILFAVVRVAVAALLIFAILVLRKRISALITGRSVSAPALQHQ